MPAVTTQTTALLQTPPGLGGIAVILIRGPKTAQILAEVFRPRCSHTKGGEGVLQLGYLINEGEPLDEAIVHHCGQGAAINIHGGPAAARAALELLGRCGATVRPAAAAAPESFPPAHPRWNNPAIGAEMLKALPLARSATVAAALTQQWSAGISRLARSDPTAGALRQAAVGLRRMGRLLRPAEVVLAGPTNVGKSTLTNALTGREVSIVHSAPGTTRDWVTELGLLEGLPVWLTDTAGLWNPPADIDAEAVRRARQRAENADLLLLVAAGEPVEIPDWLGAKKLLRVSAKADVCPPKGEADAIVSALSGEGLSDLRKAIVRSLDLGGFEPASPMAFTRRQARLLLEAARAMECSEPRSAQRALTSLLEGKQQLD